jgi:hypothetical protein
MHIESEISAHQALYAQTLNGFLRYRRTISAIPSDSVADDPSSPHCNNPFLSGLDAASLVCFVLETRPQVYFEFGSGNSTKFARHAIKSDGLRTKVISVDPQPRAEIDALCDKFCRMRLEDSEHQSSQSYRLVIFSFSTDRTASSPILTSRYSSLRSYQASHQEFWSIFTISFFRWIYPPDWNDRFYSEQYI